MAIDSIRSFLKTGKRPNNSELRGKFNRKVSVFDDFLRIHASKLITAHGLRRSATIVEIAAKVGGKTLPYLDAWEWFIENYAQEPREPWDWHDWVLDDLRKGIRRVRIEQAEKREAYIQRQAALAAQKIPGSEFYQSMAWRELRYAVLKKSAGVCEACRRAAREHGVVLHVDHILPRSQFPDLALEETNLQVLCDDCNIGKGVDDTTDWRETETQPVDVISK